MISKRKLVILAMVAISLNSFAAGPLRLAVAGVTHDHLWGVVSALKAGEIEVVGVCECDSVYLRDNILRGLVADSLFFGNLDQMVEKTIPEAVVAYGSIYDHMAVVEACAPRHIDVMVEKPLAVSVEHADRMESLARKYGIILLTNYETCWYRSNHYAAKLAADLGQIFRIEVYDGHQGPIEIGCSKRFTDWLTDPVKNGAGAMTDFGCYGANLATWLLKGEEPIDVYATLQHVKPDVYPKVDDDATILVRYSNVTVQIMASWCWPYNRKDMYIYGLKGVIHQRDDIHVDDTEAPRLAAPYDSSFRYLKAVVRGEIEVGKFDMASLENNMLVVKILDAARRSAASGKAEKL